MTKSKLCTLLVVFLLLWPWSLLAQKNKYSPKNFYSNLKSQADISIEWEKEKIPFQIRTFELESEKALEIRKIISTELSDPLPKWIKSEIRGPFRIKKGDLLPIAFVIENTSDQPLYFFTNEHAALPHEQSYGASLTCLCDHRIRLIKPKSRWIRISSVQISKQSPGSRYIFRSKLIGLSESYIRENNLERLVEK